MSFSVFYKDGGDDMARWSKVAEEVSPQLLTGLMNTIRKDLCPTANIAAIDDLYCEVRYITYDMRSIEIVGCSDLNTAFSVLHKTLNLRVGLTRERNNQIGVLWG